MSIFRAATPEGSLHKAKTESVVCICALWATEEMCSMFVTVDLFSAADLPIGTSVDYS